MAKQQKYKAGVSKNLMWNDVMDAAFIQCMVELKEKHQVENGNFKQGTFNEIADMMEAKVPGCGVKGVPNVKSRLKWMKQRFYAIRQMRNESGFGWMEEMMAITVDDAIFLEYVKNHPNCAGLNRVSFPHYDELVNVFGKGRATREETVGAIEEPLPTFEHEQFIQLDDDEYNEEVVRQIINDGVQTHINAKPIKIEKRQYNMSGTPQLSKKARQACEVDGFMADMSTTLSPITKVLNKTAKAIGSLMSEDSLEKAKKKAYEDLLATQRKDAVSVMDKIEGLTRIQAIKASRRLVQVQDDKQLQLFFDFETDDDRLAFVLDLLAE